MVIDRGVAFIVGEATIEPDGTGPEEVGIEHDREEDAGDTDSVIFPDVLPGEGGAGMASPVVAAAPG